MNLIRHSWCCDKIKTFWNVDSLMKCQKPHEARAKTAFVIVYSQTQQILLGQHFSQKASVKKWCSSSHKWLKVMIAQPELEMFLQDVVRKEVNKTSAAGFQVRGRRASTLFKCPWAKLKIPACRGATAAALQLTSESAGEAAQISLQGSIL